MYPGFIKNTIYGEWVEDVSIYDELLEKMIIINAMCEKMKIPELLKKSLIPMMKINQKIIVL